MCVSSLRGGIFKKELGVVERALDLELGTCIFFLFYIFNGV